MDPAYIGLGGNVGDVAGTISRAAAALAALMYPLRDRLDGQRVGVVVCGANIDPETFTKHITLS